MEILLQIVSDTTELLACSSFKKNTISLHEVQTGKTLLTFPGTQMFRLPEAGI